MINAAPSHCHQLGNNTGQIELRPIQAQIAARLSGSQLPSIHGLLRINNPAVGQRVHTVNESELRSIYTCLEVFLARFAYRYRLDASDLDEIRQDAVVCWWNYTRRTKTKIPPNALARAIARRQLYGHLRREINRRRHEGNYEVAWMGERSEKEVLGTDTIFEVIHALPVDQRQLVHDRIEGLTHREIACEQGVNERTVRQRWKKTKSTLKQRLRSRLRQDHDGQSSHPLLRV